VVRSRKITAYVCINDLTAIGAMDALRDRGIRVPEDISVLGSEDIYMARFVNPALTTVRLDRKAPWRASVPRPAEHVAQEALRRRARTR